MKRGFVDDRIHRRSILSQWHAVRVRIQQHDLAIKWKLFPRYCPFVREITSQWASDANFNIFFHVGPQKLLNKQSTDRGFETS